MAVERRAVERVRRLAARLDQAADPEAALESLKDSREWKDAARTGRDAMRVQGFQRDDDGEGTP